MLSVEAVQETVIAFRLILLSVTLVGVVGASVSLLV